MSNLASRTGWPIVGVGLAFDRPWRARAGSICGPYPCRKACAVTPRSIIVPPNADRDTLENYRTTVERAMTTYHEAEAWVEQLTRQA